MLKAPVEIPVAPPQGSFRAAGTRDRDRTPSTGFSSLIDDGAGAERPAPKSTESGASRATGFRSRDAKATAPDTKPAPRETTTAPSEAATPSISDKSSTEPKPAKPSADAVAIRPDAPQAADAASAVEVVTLLEFALQTVVADTPQTKEPVKQDDQQPPAGPADAALPDIVPSTDDSANPVPQPSAPSPQTVLPMPISVPVAPQFASAQPSAAGATPSDTTQPIAARTSGPGDVAPPVASAERDGSEMPNHKTIADPATIPAPEIPPSVTSPTKVVSKAAKAASAPEVKLNAVVPNTDGTAVKVDAAPVETDSQAVASAEPAKSVASGTDLGTTTDKISASTDPDLAKKEVPSEATPRTASPVRPSMAAAVVDAPSGIILPSLPHHGSAQLLHASAPIAPAMHLTATIAADAPVPLNGLAVEIATRHLSGATSFAIRLDPADLGRIDVRLEIDKQGQVTSHLTVEKPETLAMLRQDAPQLQRALNDGGLKTSDNALQFSLGDQASPQQNADRGNQRHPQRLIVQTDDNIAAAPQLRGYGQLLGSRGGIDIRV